MGQRAVAVTGASGFVGGAIATAFRKAGWRVVELTRKDFDLARPLANHGLLEDTDAVIHCAYEARSIQNNVDGTKRLLEASRRAGVRSFVLVSSLAADEHSASSYGRIKHELERTLDTDRDVILRPGLVAGDGGLFQDLKESMRRFRIAPIFAGGRQPVYVVDVQEVASAVVALIENNAHGLYILAPARAVQLRELYAMLAARMNIRVLLVPLPYGLALAAISLFERLGLRMPVSSESLRGMRNLRTIDVPTYADVGFRFADAATVVANAGARP